MKTNDKNPGTVPYLVVDRQLQSLMNPKDGLLGEPSRGPISWALLDAARKDESAWLVATNGHALARIAVPWSGDQPVLLRLLGPNLRSGESVTIPDVLTLKAGDHPLLSEGAKDRRSYVLQVTAAQDYPDYRQVIPSAEPRKGFRFGVNPVLLDTFVGAVFPGAHLPSWTAPTFTLDGSEHATLGPIRIAHEEPGKATSEVIVMPMRVCKEEVSKSGKVREVCVSGAFGFPSDGPVSPDVERLEAALREAEEEIEALRKRYNEAHAEATSLRAGNHALMKGGAEPGAITALEQEVADAKNALSRERAEVASLREQLAEVERDRKEADLFLKSAREERDLAERLLDAERKQAMEASPVVSLDALAKRDAELAMLRAAMQAERVETQKALDDAELLVQARNAENACLSDLVKALQADLARAVQHMAPEVAPESVPHKGCAVCNPDAYPRPMDALDALFGE